jgi:hypothetical protein
MKRAVPKVDNNNPVFFMPYARYHFNLSIALGGRSITTCLVLIRELRLGK